MAWAEAKARIVTVLSGLAITSPVAQTVSRVYSDPPGTVTDVPCVVLYPPARSPQRTGLVKEKTYKVRLRLLLTDADLAQASALVDAYSEAIMDIFDAESVSSLQGTATDISGPDVEEAAAFTYGAKTYTGFDSILTVIIHGSLL